MSKFSEWISDPTNRFIASQVPTHVAEQIWEASKTSTMSSILDSLDKGILIVNPNHQKESS